MVSKSSQQSELCGDTSVCVGDCYPTNTLQQGANAAAMEFFFFFFNYFGNCPSHDTFTNACSPFKYSKIVQISQTCTKKKKRKVDVFVFVCWTDLLSMQKVDLNATAACHPRDKRVACRFTDCSCAVTHPESNRPAVDACGCVCRHVPRPRLLWQKRGKLGRLQKNNNSFWPESVLNSYYSPHTGMPDSWGFSKRLWSSFRDASSFSWSAESTM